MDERHHRSRCSNSFPPSTGRDSIVSITSTFTFCGASTTVAYDFPTALHSATTGADAFSIATTGDDAFSIATTGDDAFSIATTAFNVPETAPRVKDALRITFLGSG